MKKTILTLALLGIVPLVANQARATAYTYSDTINLGNVTNQAGFNWNLSFPALSLVAGDTLSGTITFDQRLQINDAAGSSFYLGITIDPTNPSITTILNETTTLLGVQGSFTDGNSKAFVVGGLTPAYFSSYPTGGNVSFSGFSYSATVTSIGGAVTNNYYSGGLLSAGVSGTHGTISAVPEPSTYALCGLGALALVIAARRKVF